MSTRDSNRISVELEGTGSFRGAKVTRVKIDEEIFHLEAQLLQLRRQRNALAPINQIPEEVLLRIMVELLPGIPTPPVSWIQFTQVCHQWRMTSIAYPLLWTTLHVSHMNPFWTRTFIQRSRDNPLTIHHTCSSQPADLVKTGLTFVMDRVIEFHCSDSETQKGKPVLDLFPFSKSPLKSLTIRDYMQMDRNWTPNFSLQHLDLSNSQFDASLISQSLVTLKLQDLDAYSLPSISHFYKTLSTLTNLRHLALTQVLTKVASKTKLRFLPPVPHISIPSLQNLELTDESEKECARLLSLVSFPGLTRLHILFDQGPTSLSALRKGLVKTWAETQLLDLSHHNIDYPQFRLTTNGQCNKFKFISSIDPADTMVEIRWKSDVKSFNNLITTLPQDKLHFVEVSWRMASEEDFSTLTSYLSKLPYVEKLQLICNQNNRLFFTFLQFGIPSHRCIQPTVSPQNPSLGLNPSSTACASCRAFASTFFPSLRSVVFYKAQDMTCVPPQLLCDFLAHRSTCGQPMSSISIYYSGLVQGTSIEQVLVQKLHKIDAEIRRGDGGAVNIILAKV